MYTRKKRQTYFFLYSHNFSFWENILAVYMRIFLLSTWVMGKQQGQVIHEEQEQACSFTFHWRESFSPCSIHRYLLSTIYEVTCIGSSYSGNMLRVGVGVNCKVFRSLGAQLRPHTFCVSIGILTCPLVSFTMHWRLRFLGLVYKDLLLHIYSQKLNGFIKIGPLKFNTCLNILLIIPQ